jgi:hypothetical protein
LRWPLLGQWFVMAEFDPAIHVFRFSVRRGCPAQGRA